MWNPFRTSVSPEHLASRIMERYGHNDAITLTTEGLATTTDVHDGIARNCGPFVVSRKEVTRQLGPFPAGTPRHLTRDTLLAALAPFASEQRRFGPAELDHLRQHIGEVQTVTHGDFDMELRMFTGSPRQRVTAGDIYRL